MPLSFIPFLLLAIPLLEIATFVVVGGQIGVLPTIGLVLATAITGSILLRIQGFGVLARIKATVEEGGVPGRELVHGFMIMAAGILLLTPGFITDTLGFLLFIPAIRELAWKLLRNRIAVTVAGASSGTRGGPRSRGRTIDLDDDEFEREGNDPRNDGPDRLR